MEDLTGLVGHTGTTRVREWEERLEELNITTAYTVAPSTGTPGRVGGVDLGSANGFARLGGFQPFPPVGLSATLGARDVPKNRPVRTTSSRVEVRHGDRENRGTPETAIRRRMA